MKCPQCNGSCYRFPDVKTGYTYSGNQRLVVGPWRCEECGWYEGHETEAAIDADRKDEETKQC